MGPRERKFKCHRCGKPFEGFTYVDLKTRYYYCVECAKDMKLL